jgi:nitroreductase
MLMDIIDAINMRKSVRAFKPDPITKAVLEKVLTTAVRAPSAINSQPWEFVVATGEKLQAYKDLSIAKLNAREAMDLVLYPGNALGDLRTISPERTIGATARTLEVMGIMRDDKVKRAEWAKQGLGFFGAPAVIFLLLDKKYANSAYFDLGMVSYGICLAALDAGLGTIIMVQGVAYGQALRSTLGIPESKNIIVSIAIGYPDLMHPTSQVRSEREPLAINTTWVGF